MTQTLETLETLETELKATIEDCKIATREAAEMLWALADECSEWGRQSLSHTLYPPAEREAKMKREFLRLAQRLDQVARDLVGERSQ